MSEKLDYLAENISVSDALFVVSGSTLKATIFTAVVVVFVIYGFLDSLVIQTLPHAIIPSIAFAYMAKKWYSGILERVGIGILMGFLFGLLLRAIGIVLVLMVDVIGMQTTIFAVIVESGALAFWLYTDLTSWVAEDIDQKEKARKYREEQAAKKAAEQP